MYHLLIKGTLSVGGFRYVRKALCGKGFWVFTAFRKERIKRRNQAFLMQDAEKQSKVSENRLTFGLGCAFCEGVCIGSPDERYPNKINGFRNEVGMFLPENQVHRSESDLGFFA